MTQMMERTGKIWKAQQAISLILIVVGAYFLLRSESVAGGISCALGAAWFVVASIGAWWCHG